MGITKLTTVIDSSYQGEVELLLQNEDKKRLLLEPEELTWVLCVLLPSSTGPTKNPVETKQNQEHQRFRSCRNKDWAQPSLIQSRC